MYFLQSLKLYKKPKLNILFNVFIQKLKTSGLKHEYEEIQTTHKNILIKKLVLSNIFENINNVSSLIHSYCIQKRNPHISYSFVADVSVAENIAKSILKNMNSNNDVVIEGNPGIGLITHHLLQSRIKKIKIIEFKRKHKTVLSDIISRNLDVITLEKGNIFAPTSRTKTLIMNLIECGLGLGKSVTVVGVVPNFSFFTILTKAVLDGNLYDQIGLEFLLIVSEQVLNNINDFKKAKAKFNVYCLFNLYFSFSIIEEYPREAFLPLSDKDDKLMYLVKFEKKKNLPASMMDDETLNYYITFLKVMEKSRYAFVIKSLEKWFPDCGPLLISNGLGYANQVCDLTAEDSLEIFQILSKSDSFANFKTLQPIFESGRLYLQEPETQDIAGQTLDPNNFDELKETRNS